MKKIAIAVFIMAWPAIIFAQTEKLKSGVYEWDGLKAEKTKSGEYREIFDGPTSVFKNLEIRVTSLDPGKELHESPAGKDVEALFIIKEGHVKQTINDNTKKLGPGSVILICPGDEYAMQNEDDNKAVFYEIKWELPMEADLQKKETASCSEMYDWNDLAFRETQKGGTRSVMRRPTALLAEFEMHVTTLNEGIKSHDPHSHPSEEIILVKSGDVEEIIDGKAYKAGPGSLIFLGLPSSHGISNIGIGACEYYAFKWFPSLPDPVQ